MRAGAVVALVSDAGMPLVSDPGFVLVAACVAAGLAVEVLPGPSAAIAALVASALPAERWRFVGFLPRKRGELREAFGVARDARGVRVAAPDRRVAARARRARSRAPGGGLPRADEAARGGRARGSAAELAARYADEPPRGEVVLVVGAGAAVEGDLGPALDALRRLSTPAPSRGRRRASWPTSPA